MVVARPVKVRQVVQVSIMGTRRPYTYAWEFMPGVVAPLAVGDRVELPPNQVQEEGSSGTVSALGSPYQGEMKFIVRKIEPKSTWEPYATGPDEVAVRKTGEDIWDNFGQGDYA